jgi:transposase
MSEHAALIWPPTGRVYLAVGATDMRKAINGLSIIVEQAMGRNVFAGDLFAFCNRDRTIVKILYWDASGFCLWQKRLEKHRFAWPQTGEDAVCLDGRRLQWLLAGLDITSAHETLKYSAVA